MRTWAPPECCGLGISRCCMKQSKMKMTSDGNRCRLCAVPLYGELQEILGSSYLRLIKPAAEAAGYGSLYIVRGVSVRMQPGCRPVNYLAGANILS